MKTLILSLTLFLLTACAGSGVTDFDREFFTDQLVTRSLLKMQNPAAAESRAKLFLQVADIADLTTAPDATGKLMQDAIAAMTATQNLPPEDQKLVAYLVHRMLPAEVDLNVPLSPPQKKSIAVYSTTIKNAVSSWRARK